VGDVPELTEDASAEFVTQALRSTGVIDDDTVVAELEHDRIGEGVGLMCDLARLTLRYGGPAHGAPSSVILKIPSRYPENRAVGNHFRLYEREGRFYEHIGRAIAVRTPNCLFNHIDAEAGEFVLILEDFGARTMVSQVVGLDAERAAESVRAIARVHAQFWEAPELDGFDWLPQAIDPEVLGAGQAYRDAWPVFQERFGADLPEGSAELAELVGSTWEATAQSVFDESPLTLCHGDYRADNLMFDDSVTGDGHVGVLDWQIAFRGAGIGDVAYLIAQSLTTPMRRAHDRELVEQWYDELSSTLGRAPDDYTTDDAWDGYRKATATMTALPVIGGSQSDLANERGVQLVHEMSVRAFSAALELDAAALFST
jgi:aminoglycoside/choline kinase family phosphotransferase